MWEGKGAWGRPWSWPAGDTQGIVLCPDVQQRVFADVRLHWAFFDGADGVACFIEDKGDSPPGLSMTLFPERTECEETKPQSGQTEFQLRARLHPSLFLICCNVSFPTMPSCHALPCPALPRPAPPYPARPALPRPAPPCPALRCPTLPYPALPCPALASLLY